MAKTDITPDSLASKTFLITVVGAILYIGVVFAFVIGGNRREEAAGKPSEISIATPIDHPEQHHD
jgi:hypothetical protein